MRRQFLGYFGNMGNNDKNQVRIGLLGCGTVGSALAELIDAQADEIFTRLGLKLDIVKVGVSSTKKPRPKCLSKKIITTDLSEIISDPEIQIIVELMGGVKPAKDLAVQALASKKILVTANKELLARHGPELFEVAQRSGSRILYEAAVAGAIPLVRTLRESLLGEPVKRLTGILNGTTNYVLSSMTESKSSYEEALAKARDLGYAESDPSSDVSGQDAAFKLVLLAGIAFGQAVDPNSVFCEGIEGVDAQDIVYAGRLGYTLKLLATCEKLNGQIAIKVHPAMVPNQHPLASVDGSFNAIFIEGDAVGQLMLHGYGAGGAPTASAVLGDILDAATRPAPQIGDLNLGPADIRPIEELESAYYLRMEVEDRPGVLAAVAQTFGSHNISIRLMEQDMEYELKDGPARLIFITHRAKEKDFAATKQELQQLDAVKNIASSLRVVEMDG